MTEKNQDPQALLARMVHCLATPSNSTVGDYFDAEQSLDEYCAAHGFIWAFDDNGVPYLEKASDRARRIVEGIAQHASREAEMTPVATTLEDTTGKILGFLINAAPCGHDFIIPCDFDVFLDGITYCTDDNCGVGYWLELGEDGWPIGVEPFGR